MLYKHERSRKNEIEIRQIYKNGKLIYTDQTIGKEVFSSGTVEIINNALRTNIEELLKGSGQEHEDFLHGLPEAKEIIDFLIETSDPEKAFFVTGGIKCGAEKYLMERLKDSTKKFDLLNFVTEQAIMRKEDIVVPKVVTDAVIIENSSHNILSSNFLLPKLVGDFMKEHNGIMVAMGGSAVVADMVQYSFNVGDIDIYLSSEIKGTARNKTRQYTDYTRNRKKPIGGSIYIFGSAKEFKSLLAEKNPEIFAGNRGIEK